MVNAGTGMDFSIDRFRVDGKVAIVTGAGGRGNNIGRAYSIGLANAGAALVVADINGDGARSVADEIVAAGGKAISCTVDIARPEMVTAMVETAVATFGGIDILVNNAALMVELSHEPVAGLPLDEWNRVMAVNLTGALICSQAVAHEMRRRGGGRIVNQVSGGAFPALSTYGISKLALVGLTTTLALELGKHGITVNAIAPGHVTSDAGRMLPDDSPFLQFLEATVALRAGGTPDELVGALLLLCSPAGAWITGQTIHVDGGWILRP